MRGRGRIGLVLAVALLALPAIALAAVARPRAGHWKISGNGGFTVGPGRSAVSGFHITGTNCSLGKLRVLGQQKLRTVTSAGVTNWIVGYGDPKRTNPNDLSGVVPQRVKIRSGSKTINGRLDIIFAVDGDAGDNEGNLVIGGCYLPFDPTR
jgi:hypothetical protein